MSQGKSVVIYIAMWIFATNRKLFNFRRVLTLRHMSRAISVSFHYRVFALASLKLLLFSELLRQGNFYRRMAQ